MDEFLFHWLGGPRFSVVFHFMLDKYRSKIFLARSLVMLYEFDEYSCKFCADVMLTGPHIQDTLLCVFQTFCLHFRKAEEEEQKRKAAEEEAAKKSAAASQQQMSDDQRLQELQVRQALNQQTHAQFKTYAETQFPGDQLQVLFSVLLLSPLLMLLLHYLCLRHFNV